MYNIFLNMIKDKKLLAHINMDKRETLKEHTLLTEEYYKKIVKEKNLENIINNLCSFFKCSDFIKDMFKNAIIFHDLGKVNPSFQCIKLNNKISSFINDSKYNSNHSLLSAYIYISKYFDYINKTYPRDKDRQINKRNKNTRIYLKSIVCTFGFLISKHHSFLNNELFNADLNNLTFIDKINELNTCIQVDNYYLSAINEDLDLNILQVKNINNSIEFMVLCKILYSLLISADYMATYDFINSTKVTDLGLFNVELKSLFKNTFENNDIVHSTREHNYNIPINKLRGKIFLETEETLVKNKDKSIFFLESPTGSGKTYCSLNLLLNLLENEDINKAYYVFPFNNLSEQTYNTISNIFPNYNDFICEVNSITNIKEKTNNFQTDYLNKLFLNYPLSILSHVELFNILFGCGKSSNFNFYNLANSIIILDEIQNYRISIWKEIINMLLKYAKLLNIKIIIMSATLPKLDLLLEENLDIVDLLPNKKTYYTDPLFKNRVKLRFDLLKNKQNLDSLLEEVKKEIKNYNKFLIEFQDKTNCRLFYYLLKDTIKDYEIYELTGDDNAIYRNYVINRTKIDNIKMIIVGTQVIEAGINIDMDYGFKERSIIESEEQFLGRINRSAVKDNCYVAFFTLEESKTQFLYKDDIRFKYSSNNNIFKKTLINKDFYSYYKSVLLEIEQRRSLINAENYQMFLNEIDNLLFLSIEKRMQLIEHNTISIYIPHTKIKGISGYSLWKEYSQIISSTKLDFATKKVLISRLSKNMNIFVFNIFNNKKFKLDTIECVNGIYYLKNGEDFITNEGKLDREHLENYLCH